MYSGVVDSLGPRNRQRIIYVNLRDATCNSGSTAKCNGDFNKET